MAEKELEVRGKKIRMKAKKFKERYLIIVIHFLWVTMRENFEVHPLVYNEEKMVHGLFSNFIRIYDLDKYQS